MQKNPKKDKHYLVGQNLCLFGMSVWQCFQNVCLGCLCLFRSLFKMSVWVVSVCLGVFSECLFGLSLSVWVVSVCLGVFSECLFGLSV